MTMNERDTSMLTINVKTKTAENTVDLVDDLKIDSANINEAFCEQPAKFAWWATVAVQAKALVDHKKAEIERQEDYLKKTLVGELDAEARADLELNGEKITESKVTNGIYVHPKYLEEQQKLYNLKDELLDLTSQWTTLDIAKEAMNQRKDMLISLGANMRAEGNNAEVFLRQRAQEVINSKKL